MIYSNSTTQKYTISKFSYSFKTNTQYVKLQILAKKEPSLLIRKKKKEEKNQKTKKPHTPKTDYEMCRMQGLITFMLH